MGSLTLGLPSKGRLMEATIEWFGARGITIRRSGAGREYAAQAEGVEGLDIVMLSAGEIPRELDRGRIHLGVTGEDLIREKIAGWEHRVKIATAMGFGHADLVVAVPAWWVDVETMADLDEACAQFRARHGTALRIGTKYHALTRDFFRRKGVADYRIVDSQGATEAGPKNQSFEAIVDITSSGETLTANHLRVLSDGMILQSQASLCLSLAADWGAEAMRARDRLGTKLGLALG